MQISNRSQYLPSTFDPYSDHDEMPCRYGTRRSINVVMKAHGLSD
jgi:hypothetical protein